MRKSPSHSPGNNKPGSKNSFKKNDGSKSHSKDDRASFKMNYDGRGTTPGEGRPVRAAKPYSGRIAEGGKPNRPFGKPTSGKDSRNRQDSRDDKPGKTFDKAHKPGNSSRPFGDRPKPSFGAGEKKDGEGSKPRKEFDKPGSANDSRPFNDRPKRSDAGRNDTFDKPSFRKDDNRNGDNRPRREFGKPGKAVGDSRPFRDRPKPGDGEKPFNKGGFVKKARKQEHTSPKFGEVMDQAFNRHVSKHKESAADDVIARPQQFEDQVFGELAEPVAEDRPKRPFEKKKNANPGKKRFIHDHSEGRKKKYKDDDDTDGDEEDKEINQKNGPRLEMPLNKFIAHSGECSRRDAAELVRQGKVKVNGELVLDPGYRVKHDDMVTMSGKKLTPQKDMVYILLNKPKGFITTNDDPQGRKTVMELVGNADVDRLFPVGRLDRDTSGLLLITNDGDLTQKLCHPSYAIKKVYQVTLDKPLTNADFDKIVAGMELEDGIAKVDALSYLEKKNELGLEIHSGRNRIVRRIFEALNYEVVKLDRVMYAGLTKKNLPRSKWRYLDPREVLLLKHFKS